MKEVFFIAEAGVNHNGSLTLAKELVHAAAEAKASAIKFQTFKTENLVTASALKAAYQIETTGAHESQAMMLKRLELPYDWHFELRDLAKKLGLEFMSTPFDLDSLDFLVNSVQVSRLKIASGDNNNALLLYEAGRSGRTVILSTGYLTLGGIERALEFLALGYMSEKEDGCTPSSKKAGFAYAQATASGLLQEKVTLLHCTSEYPPSMASVNLRCIQTMKEAFHLEVGFSDHSIGTSISCAAVALGATVIEKHFTTSKDLPGPDHRASLSPDELLTQVKSIRDVEMALGRNSKYPTESERLNRLVAQKSVVAAKPILRGEVLSASNLTIKRPASGLAPERYWELLDTVADRDYKADEMIRPNGRP